MPENECQIFHACEFRQPTSCSWSSSLHCQTNVPYIPHPKIMLPGFVPHPKIMLPGFVNLHTTLFAYKIAWAGLTPDMCTVAPSQYLHNLPLQGAKLQGYTTCRWCGTTGCPPGLAAPPAAVPPPTWIPAPPMSFRICSRPGSAHVPRPKLVSSPAALQPPWACPYCRVLRVA